MRGRTSSSQGRSAALGIGVDVVGDPVVAQLALRRLRRAGPSRRATDCASCSKTARQCGRGTPSASKTLVVAFGCQAIVVEQVARHVTAQGSTRIRAWQSRAADSLTSWAPQIEREREVRIALLGRHEHAPRRVADAEEARQAPALGFVGVDGKVVVACVRPDARRGTCSRRASAASRCPPGRRRAARARRSSDAGTRAAARRGSGRRRRIRRPSPVGCSGTRPAVAGDARGGRRSSPVALDLQALDRRIDVAHGAARRRASSPSTCHGSSACAQLDVHARCARTRRSSGKRNSKCGANHAGSSS